MKTSTRSLVLVFVLFALVIGSGYAQVTPADSRLDYPIEWSGQVGVFSGTPSVRQLYESGCLRDMANQKGTFKASIAKKTVTEKSVTYVVDTKINDVTYLSVTSRYAFDDANQTARLVYFYVVNKKSGETAEYQYENTPRSAGQLLGALCETGKVYIDFAKVNDLLSSQ